MGIPFECDLCHFRNVNRRDPMVGSAKDNHTLMIIRRVNLDAMWSRESSTVLANLSRLRLDYHSTMAVCSIDEPLPVLGNDTVKDRVGMKCAIYTLNASLRAGKYADHLQWDVMRKTVTWWNNLFEAGETSEEASAFASHGQKSYLTDAPTAARFFARFMLGAKRRMGIIRRQDEALAIAQLMGIIELAEEDWKVSQSDGEKRLIEEFVSFLIIAFSLSLRGEEVPLVSLAGLIEFWDETKTHPVPHIMITLRGKFKGEQNLRWHLLPLADKSKSGIPSRRWISRLVHRRVRLEGRKTGFLFQRSDKSRASMGDYNEVFRGYLERTRNRYPSRFTNTIKIEDFSLRRSPRRGSTTHASNNMVDPVAIELINRWRKMEAARGALPGLAMRQVYTQLSGVLDSLLRYAGSH